MYLQLRRWLSSPRADRWVLVASLMLACVSLDTGLGADDHIHQLVMRGTHRLGGFADDGWDLFRFAGEPARNRQNMLDGVFPWWADPQASLAFWRPLTVLTHRLDHRFWSDSPLWMHAQSIGFFALLLLGARALYKRLLPGPWVAVLAFAIFALDDARAPPLTWIANRHAVISAAAAVWMLVAHDRWVRQGWRPGSFLAVGALIVGLLAGESTLAVGAYLFAHACFLDRGPWVGRMLRLAPYAGVVVAWRIVYKMLGYGTHGSGVYIDPTQRPLEFLAFAVQRLPVLMLGQLGFPWSDGWAAYDLIWPPAKILVMALALIVLLGLGWLLVPLLRREPRMRFWVVGSLLAAVPACATFPADRMLTFVSLGAAGALAELFAAVTTRRGRDARAASEAGAPGELQALFGSRLRSGAAIWAAHGIVLVHMIAAPLLFPTRARGVVDVRESLQRAERSVPEPEPGVDRTLVYVNPPSDPFACYVPIMRAAEEGGPPPDPQRWLAVGVTSVTLQRLGERTLRVRQEGGFLPGAAERMLRSSVNPFHVGQVVHVPPLHVHIEEVTEDGRPAVVRARFDRPLDDPSLVWLRWEQDGFVPYAPPAVGERDVLPPVDLLQAIYGD